MSIVDQIDRAAYQIYETCGRVPQCLFVHPATLQRIRREFHRISAFESDAAGISILQTISGPVSVSSRNDVADGVLQFEDNEVTYHDRVDDGHWRVRRAFCYDPVVIVVEEVV